MNENDKMFLRWLFLRSWRERPSLPPISAHMHFCIQPAYRGRYVAQRLWRAFEHKLRTYGVPHYYGEVITSRPDIVTRVYRRYGLKVYSQTRSTMFAHVHDTPVWVLCFTK